MADDNNAETEKQSELGAPQEAAEPGKSPKGSRKDLKGESKLASLARRSRQKPPAKENAAVDLVTRFTEGVFFKAKIIGVEDVPDARGDKMCQISLQRLKAVVKNSGGHKTRVTVCVSVEGLKIREEKTADLLYHHPVHRISFISQDVTDSRAFGYIFGSPDLGHKFYALKTEKQARALIIAMRDLFQVVYDLKKQEIDMARQHRKTLEEQQLAATLPQVESSPDSPEQFTPSPPAVVTPEEDVADFLLLETELDNLRMGLTQIDTSISAEEVQKSQDELDKLFDDPFGDSFRPMPQQAAQAQPQQQNQQQTLLQQVSQQAQQSPFQPAPQQQQQAPFLPAPQQQQQPFQPAPQQQHQLPFQPTPQQQQPFQPAPQQQQPFQPVPQQQPFQQVPQQQSPFHSVPQQQQGLFQQQPAFPPAPQGTQFQQPAQPFQANFGFGAPPAAQPAPAFVSPQASPFMSQPGAAVPPNVTGQQQMNNLFNAPRPASAPISNNPFGSPAFAPANPAPVPAQSQTFNVLDAVDQPNSNPFGGAILSPEKPPSSSEPVKPPVNTNQGPVDLFSALDPLGSNREVKNKQQFFKELKPQKKAMKDLSGNNLNFA